MSGTHVHAPGWVKDRDPEWRKEMQEIHRHVAERFHVYKRNRDGTREWSAVVRPFTGCDLAEFLAGKNHTFCYLQYVGGRNIYCGCNLCTGQTGRRRDRRHARHEKQQVCRDLLKDPFIGTEFQRMDWDINASRVW